jgi:flagellar biosynthesis protein FlhG
MATAISGFKWVSMDNSVEKTAKIITIASGKGGVGRTNLCLNLALTLLNDQQKVCLLDANLGLTNVDALLGIEAEHSLADVIDDKYSLDQVMLIGPRSLCIVPGGSALEAGSHKKRVKHRSVKDVLRLILRLLQDYDTLVIDTEAGISDSVVSLLGAASIPILVITPEPTSFKAAYSLLRTYQGNGKKRIAFILVNQALSAEHAREIFGEFRAFVNGNLKIPLKPIGYVEVDPNVAHAVAQQIPFVEL